MWALTRILPGVEVFAPQILFVGGSIVFLSLTDAPGSPIILGVPALAATMLMVRPVSAALLLSGFVLAVCFAAAGWRWGASGTFSLGRAIALLAAALAPAMLLPLERAGLMATVIASAGAFAIIMVDSHDRRVGVDAVLIAYCAALVTPTMPPRASVFALVVAAVVLLLRRPGPFTAGLVVLLVLIGGKWYLPVLLAIAAGFALNRYRVATQRVPENARAFALPFAVGLPVAALSTLSVAPDAWWRIKSVGTAAAVAAAVLAAGALVVQPSLATIYAITAIACLLLVGDRREGSWSTVLVAFVLAMSGLTAWSGTMSASFPLPLPLAVIVLLGILAMAGGSIAVRMAGVDHDGAERGASGSVPLQLASALVAGLAAAIVLLHPSLNPSAEVIATDVRLSAGETVTLDLPRDVGLLRLRIAGGNVAGLEGGTVVGVARIEPGGGTLALRIGDFADWGSNRRAHFLSAENPRSAVPAGVIHESGRDAFLSGAGLVRVKAAGAERLTIEAFPSIGETGLLMIETVEVEK